jgi:branched-subunit amino acid transport protein
MHASAFEDNALSIVVSMTVLFLKGRISLFFKSMFLASWSFRILEFLPAAVMTVEIDIKKEKVR